MTSKPPPDHAMSFRTFLLEAIKHAFHGTWGFIELLHGVVFLALYAASYKWYSLKEHIPLVALIIAIMAFVLFLIRLQVVCYRLYRKAEDGRHALLTKQPEALQLKCDQLQAELAQMSTVTAELLNQVAVRGQYAVLEHEQVLQVEADGTLRGTKSITFRAVNNVSSVRSQHRGDSPLPGLTALAFTASCEKPYRVLVLSDVRSDVFKQFMLLFLPAVRTGQTAKYSVSWTWPGLWKPLIEGTVDSWSHEIESAEVVPDVRFRFRVAKGFPLLKIRNIGAGGGEGRTLGVASDGYCEYLWEMKAVPPGTKVEIHLEK